jgi:hypothetical protein
LETPISKEPKREKLPFVLDPNQKFNVWAVAKDLIGKDLSRFAVPGRPLFLSIALTHFSLVE